MSRALVAVLALLALTASALATRSDDLATTSAQLIAQAMQQSPVRQALRGESTMFALPSATLATQQSLNSIRLAAVNVAGVDGEARRSDAGDAGGDARIDLSFVAPVTAATQGSSASVDRPSGLALLLAAVLAMLFMARRRGVL